MALRSDRICGRLLEYTAMKVRLCSNGKEIPVNPFIARFISQVAVAVARSLKAPEAMESVEYLVDESEVVLRVDGRVVPLNHNRGFSQTLVRDTLCGMVRHLKGMETGAGVRIRVDWKAASQSEE